MKRLYKIAIFSIFIILLFVLTGCSSSNTANQTLSKDNYKEITEKYAEENNMTVDKYKENLKDLSNSIDEFNQSMSGDGDR